MGPPDGVNRPGHPEMGSKEAKTQQLAKRQMKDSHFWQPQGETYSNHAGRFFSPAKSSTFSLIKLDNVNVTFLDNTNLRGKFAARQIHRQLKLVSHAIILPAYAYALLPVRVTQPIV